MSLGAVARVTNRIADNMARAADETERMSRAAAGGSISLGGGARGSGSGGGNGGNGGSGGGPSSGASAGAGGGSTGATYDREAHRLLSAILYAQQQLAWTWEKRVPGNTIRGMHR